MKCIAIDDEPRALEIIENYIHKIDFLDLEGKFRGPLDAMVLLEQGGIDLVFLDINMPDITGTEFARLMGGKPMVIFTTAYSEHAIESYELDAVDYLLKPFEFGRFLKSVIRARDRYNLLSDIEDKSSLPTPQIDKHIQIKSGIETYRIEIDKIRYVEGLGNYVNVHLSDKKIVTYSSLKDFLEKLPGEQFVRIHKSYIVSLKHIKSFENHQVRLLDKTIPIGKNYKEKFIDLMKNG